MCMPNSRVRRPSGLVMVSRRQFCEGLATCLGLAAVASCSPTSSASPDAAIHPPDGAGSGGGTCSSTGVTDVGMGSTYQINSPVYVSSGNLFVVRDSGGLYALTARCTHQGATVVVSGSDFYCPRHGAQFDFDGNVVSGPVVTGLIHYAMCMLGNGHVGVNTSQTVSQTQRLNA